MEGEINRGNQQEDAGTEMKGEGIVQEQEQKQEQEQEQELCVLLEERSLDTGLEVPGVGEDATSDEHEEKDEDDGEVGAEHALALLPGAAAAEECDDDDEGGEADEDVGGGGVDVQAQVVGVVPHHFLSLKRTH